MATDTAQKLLRIRRLLGGCVKFAEDMSTDIGDRIRSLTFSLVVSFCRGIYGVLHLPFSLFLLQCNTLTIEDFQLSVVEATHFPFRPNISVFLKSHIPILQREIASLARVNKQVSITLFLSTIIMMVIIVLQDKQ